MARRGYNVRKIDPTWLYFTMPQGGTVSLTKNGTPTEVTLEYSLDNGNTWTEWVESENVRSLTLAAGQTMHVRNTSETSTGFSTYTTNHYNFSFSADTYAGGDLRSLLCKTPANASSAGRDFCFYNLFKDATNLISAKIKLLFTDLPRSFYRSMFQGCSNLIEVPETITATTASGIQPCYVMFYKCSKITRLPKLTLLQLTDYAYSDIATDCTSLNYVYTEMTDISATGCILQWLNQASATGDFYCPAELTIPTGTSGIPSGWTRHDIGSDSYLNFTMPEGGTITLTKNGTPTEVTLEYLVEGELDWVTWNEINNVRSLTLNAGGKVYIRNTSETSTRFSTGTNNYYNFAFTADTYVGGNTDSLLCKIPSNATITYYCYSRLFFNCTNLTMDNTFALPSTTLANYCYYRMFNNCTSLTMSNTFTLPSTTLANGCYYYMFQGCTSLTMNDTFTLPATTLAKECYYCMFYGCTNVNIMYTNMTDISAANCLYSWLYGVSQTGDFYCPAELTIPTGPSGIPSGWTRHDYPDNTWLHFKMPEGGTVSLTKNGTPTEVTLEYSLDNGNTWTEWVESENVRSLTLAAGQTMHVRNTSETSTGFTLGGSNYYNFAFTADTYAGGNTDSLLCKIPSNAIIANQCYRELFRNATNLLSPPQLPSTTIGNMSYVGMFNNTGITYCPELPATNLGSWCYGSMFYDCLFIVKTPYLPATVLTDHAYGNMFQNCTSLVEVQTAMTDISATSCITNWLANVSPTGDFYCPSTLTIPTGSSGIPNGWTRHDLPTT